MVLVPETRFEAFLAKIAGQEGPDLEPITRTEAFLDDIADGENNLEPRTRLEYWLQKIAERPTGGASFSQATITNNVTGGGDLQIDDTLRLEGGYVAREYPVYAGVAVGNTKTFNFPAFNPQTAGSNTAYFFIVRNGSNSTAPTVVTTETPGLTVSIAGSITPSTVRYTIVRMQVSASITEFDLVFR